jgi:hypothetical protein
MFRRYLPETGVIEYFLAGVVRSEVRLVLFFKLVPFDVSLP